VITEILLGAVLVIACVGGLAAWIRRAGAANTHVIGAPEGQVDRVFHGGIMGRHLLTSGTMVRLEICVRLRGIRLVRWVIPTWEARYDQLAIAELASLPASRIIVWLRLRGEVGAIGFLGHDSRDILALLQEHGVPVNRAVNQIRRVEELYQQ
jgi:hypothetical protein